MFKIMVLYFFPEETCLAFLSNGKKVAYNYAKA